MVLAVGFSANLQGAVNEQLRFDSLPEMVEDLDLHFQGFGDGRVFLRAVDRLLHRDGLVNGFKRLIEPALPPQDLTLELQHPGNVGMGRVAKNSILQTLCLIEDLLSQRVFLLLVATCRQPNQTSKIVRMGLPKVLLRNPERRLEMLCGLVILAPAQKETRIVVVRGGQRRVLLRIELVLDLENPFPDRLFFVKLAQMIVDLALDFEGFGDRRVHPLLP